jgi:hypothetical protein
MGNALTETEITRHLELFQTAGVGGVEVSPIYGPNGSEERFVPFLSPRWTALFAHTLREAERLSMGVDLIAGTGWPFGGPQVSADDSACVLWLEKSPGEAGTESRKRPEATPLAVQTVDGRPLPYSSRRQISRSSGPRRAVRVMSSTTSTRTRSGAICSRSMPSPLPRFRAAFSMTPGRCSGRTRPQRFSPSSSVFAATICGRI